MDWKQYAEDSLCVSSFYCFMYLYRLTMVIEKQLLGNIVLELSEQPLYPSHPNCYFIYTFLLMKSIIPKDAKTLKPLEFWISRVASCWKESG